MLTPYPEALDSTRSHPGTGSGRGLAKRVLSLGNESCGFSVREYLNDLDGPRTELALRLIAHFAEHGEDAELRAAGAARADQFRDLWDLGEAADRVRAASRRTRPASR